MSLRGDGTVVNAAARIESVAHGGQVVVSEDLVKALPTPLDPVIKLRPHPPHFLSCHCFGA